MNSETNLLDKLSLSNKYLKSKYGNWKITTQNTLIILDWDDTLFPTSWASKNKIDLMTTASRDRYIIQFQELDRTLSSFLKNISNYGRIVIITNAMADWVTISSFVIPNTYDILKTIDIISARDLFNNQTKNTIEWKKNTFQLVVDNMYNDKHVMNVISIGDAEYEHLALVNLTKHHQHKIKYLKSFRLIQNPHHDQLIDQIIVLNKCIPNLWNNRCQLCKTFHSTN